MACTPHAILAAALAVPLLPSALAETAPDAAAVSYKFLSYQDSQPGADRIRVTAPALNLLLPLSSDWSLGASHVIDAISGASPQFHTEALKKLQDKRRATDLALTRYRDNGSVTVTTSYSSEADYISRGIGASARFESDDKNTSVDAGLNLLHDSINPSNHKVEGERKNVAELSLGVTQVLTVRDLVQAVLGYSRGQGYFSDPYKVFDQRPRERNHVTVLGRWNHHIDATGGTARLSYRYYRDSFQIDAHTLSGEYVQTLPDGWTVTPLLRVYSQTAASFYVERNPASPPFPTNPPPDAAWFTEEQRLAAYGAHTLGIGVSKELGQWTMDVKFERYRQRGAWALGGSGSANLAPFDARIAQFGVAYRF
ncbi:MAG: DUF3570 domain-containing protein [Pseudomonadota bacterium]